MGRGGALGETEVRGQVDHTVLTQREVAQDGQPGRIRETAEQGHRRADIGFDRVLDRQHPGLGIHRHKTM